MRGLSAVLLWLSLLLIAYGIVAALLGLSWFISSPKYFEAAVSGGAGLAILIIRYEMSIYLLNRYVEELDEDLSRMQNDNTGVKASVDRFHLASGELQTNLDGLKESVAGVKSNLDKMQTTYQEAQTGVGRANKDIGEIHGNIAGLHEDVGKLHESFGDFHENVGGLHKDLGGIHREVGELHKDITELRENMRKMLEKLLG